MDYVALNKLDISADNVRQRSNPEFEERLSHDIEARGVLQNLIVAKGKKRGRYDIVGGGKRKRAMDIIVERGAMKADFPVPCLIIDKRQHNAGEVSLAENFQRLQMTPAEECQAFQHFIREDGDIAGVAKRFGLMRRFVEGRLRLANLAEPIFAELAAGNMTLELAKAYASTDKHEAQMRVFEQMRHAYSPSADQIRRMIANGSIRGTDPIAILVGEDAYVEAGGKIERDLFTKAEEDRWVDVEIAEQLAAAKMEAEAERLASETGLAWITPVAATDSWRARNDLEVNMVRLPPAPLTEEARTRIDEIDERLSAINDIFDEGEANEDADFDKLEEEFDALDTERTALNNPVRELPEEWRPEVGKFLILTTKGEMALEADYFSEKHLAFETDDDGNVTATSADERAATANRSSNTPQAKPEAMSPGGQKPISAKLFDELAIQRRNILSASLLTDPGLALDFAIFALSDTSYDSKGTSLRGGRPNDPANGEIPQSAAEGILAEAQDALEKGWQDPKDVAQRFLAFRELDDDAKAAWLSYAVAISLEAKKGFQSEYHPIHAVLGTILDIDPASMWRPTSPNFFDRINKTACLAALTDVGGSDLAARYAASKKGDLSSTCEKLFAGDAIVEDNVKESALSWLPEAMKFTVSVDEPEHQEDADALVNEAGNEREDLTDTEDCSSDNVSETADQEAEVAA